MAFDKLNVGSGKDIREGYENIDKRHVLGVTLVDIELGLPYKDNTFSEILCKKVLAYPKDLIFVMNEFYRVAKPGCVIKTINAYYNSQGGASDPLRLRHFTLDSFDRLIELSELESKFRVINKQLKYTRLGNIIPTEFLRRKLSLVFGEIASEVNIDLEVIK